MYGGAVCMVALFHTESIPNTQIPTVQLITKLKWWPGLKLHCIEDQGIAFSDIRVTLEFIYLGGEWHQCGKPG